ncbi:LamG-like jellyroll fold domain-containing protein [Novipirellula artificiosorum]|uniref:FecR protein n=1 Tax=Novipirellula artificiosorum TaxID=2528016 RepID=A0A5C6D8S9_9BACT|nr:LamG-like jellyroll fold domain-containing protein [Novipirellula artificiosorum]TWU33250.1 FecR protein [Novipirellula artificiosorum]
MSYRSEKWLPKLDELIGLLLDGNLGDEQAAELKELLGEQPGAARRFAEHMQLVSLLEEELPLESIESQAVAQAGAKRLRTRQRRLLLVLAPLIAASIMLAAIVNWPFGNESEKRDTAIGPTLTTGSVLDAGVAVVTQMVDVRPGANVSIDVGSSIAPGVLELETGLVQFEFYRGTVVVVEGPADLEFVDADRLICRRGKLRAHVPPQSQGFAILAPQFELVDLGTEFGVNVADDGSASVHVFEGKVELYDAQSNRSLQSRRDVLATSGVSVSAQGEFHAIASESDSFVSSARLQQLAAEQNQGRVADWRTFRDRLQNDPRVVCYYSFEPEPDAPRVLPSHRDLEPSLDGAIVGCAWSSGRWPGKRALEFKRPGDRVRLHIPGTYESLTYAAWVRLDGLDRAFNSLMLTNGFDGGEPHWQLRGDGRLLLGIRGRTGKSVAYDSEPFLDISHLGRWMHLATVHDRESRQVTHFANGEVLARLRIQESTVPLTLGDTEIGNWGTPPTYSPQKIRNLNGRIDELVLFGEALSDTEVGELYELGKP